MSSQSSSFRRSFAPGEIVADKYRIERVLGEGGMGVVVAATHLELQQRVAIKFLTAAPVNAVERFMREARTAARVKSEHVCQVFDVGRLPSGDPFMVMECLEGVDLATKLETEGAQPVDRVTEWLIQACDALASAHAQGIVHRDLKPANLFLQETSDGPKIRLLDFGISKVSSLEGGLTSTAVMMGSPFYMAPEQIESSRDVDARADIWSLGVVMHELLAGAPPFHGDSLFRLAVEIREKAPALLRTYRPDVPDEIQAAILRCLEKSPGARFEDVRDFVAEIAPFAPESVQPLIARMLRRRGVRPSSPEFELGRTTPASLPQLSLPRLPPSSSAVDGARLAEDGSERQIPQIGVSTFDPVARRSEAAPGKLRLAIGAAVGVAVLGVVGAMVWPKPQPSTHGVVALTPDSTASSMSDAGTALTTLVEPATTPAPPSSSAQATPSSSPVPGTATAETPRAAKSHGAAPVVVKPHSANAQSVATATAAPSSSQASPTPTGRKRRELDRDYEP